MALINFGDLSKPATVLVEKITDDFGGFFRPYQIKRVAKAEAEAALIHAEGEIAIANLQRRTRNRILVEEMRKQANIEAITALALPQLDEKTARPQDVPDDWIANFFERSRALYPTKTCRSCGRRFLQEKPTSRVRSQDER